MSTVERSGTAVDRARVLAVDDDAPFLALLREVVGATGHLEVAGEARSGERAVVAALALRPDMVLMDVHMPGLSGLRAAKLIKKASPSTVMVLISTTHPDEIPHHICDSFVEAVIWKSTLEPGMLDQLWLRHRVRHPG